MRLYSYFDTFELYNIRGGVGKLFFGFFASLFSFRRTLAAARAAFHGAMHRPQASQAPRDDRPRTPARTGPLPFVRPDQTERTAGTADRLATATARPATNDRHRRRRRRPTDAAGPPRTVGTDGTGRRPYAGTAGRPTTTDQRPTNRTNRTVTDRKPEREPRTGPDPGPDPGPARAGRARPGPPDRPTGPAGPAGPTGTPTDRPYPTARPYRTGPGPVPGRPVPGPVPDRYRTGRTTYDVPYRNRTDDATGRPVGRAAGRIATSRPKNQSSRRPFRYLPTDEPDDDDLQ